MFDPIRFCAAGAFLVAMHASLGAQAQQSQGLAEEVPTSQAFLSPFLDPKPPATCFKEIALEQPDMVPAVANPGERPRPRRVILAVDSSGSMRARAGGQIKIESARKAAASFLRSLPADVEVGLVVFGHKGTNKQAGKAQSCAGVDMPYPLGPTRRDAIDAAVGNLKATGWTPLAAAIRLAGESFKPSDVTGEQAIYVISDGVETCEGDPVREAAKLHTSHIRAVINIIGFDIEGKDREQLSKVAQMGGGVFLEADTGVELQRKLTEQIRETTRKSGNAIEAENAISKNTVLTTNAISGANVCVTNIISGEQIRLTNGISTERAAGRGDDVVMAEARTALATRHSALRAELESYKDRLTKAKVAVNDAIRTMKKTAQ
jgi:Ca-activated chloride channel homolog